MIGTSEQLRRPRISPEKTLSTPVVFNYAKKIPAILICNWKTFRGACWNISVPPAERKFEAKKKVNRQSGTIFGSLTLRELLSSTDGKLKVNKRLQTSKSHAE